MREVSDPFGFSNGVKVETGTCMDESRTSAEDLLMISGGYWRSFALHAGLRLGIFEELDDSPRTVSELANRIGADPDALARLLGALVATDLVSFDGDGFSATEAASRFLKHSSEESIASMILHHHFLSRAWTDLHESVLSGQPVRESASRTDSEAREAFLRGMFNQAMRIAPQLVRAIDVSDRNRLLDLGGGPGTYALHFCARNPKLEAIVYDLPTSSEVAEETIAAFDLDDRISFTGGDFLVDAIPQGCDVAWISHILHALDPSNCRTLLGNVVSSLTPGGLVLIHEFILDEDGMGPPFPALFSLNMLLQTDGGRSYTESEISEMLDECGLNNVRRLQISGPNGSGVIAGEKAAG